MSKRVLWLIPLLAVVTASGRDKAENWLEVRSQHFVVITNGNEKQGRHIADQFERMRAVFHAAFPKMQVDPGSPIVVIALKNEKDFRALEPEAYLGRGQLQLAGLFLRAPDKNYILLRLDAPGEHPYATIYHEYTHLLTSRAEEWLPLWLNEGLAEFYENTDIRDKGAILGQASPEMIVLLRQNRLIPLATLFSVDRSSPYYHEENKGSIFYAESWVLTHYIKFKDWKENTNELGDYAALLSQKTDPIAAATRTFGDLKQLQTALERYIGQSSFNAFTMSSSTIVDDAAFKVQSLNPPQADAVRADLLAYNQRSKDARFLLEEVLREDPSNVQAHETMGYLEFREGHLDEALKWYDQAVKLDSQSFLAHYYFAAISMNRGSNGEDGVESSLRTAIKLNSSFAPSYDRLAVFYAMHNRNLDEAHMLTVQAVVLDPGNINYRVNAANVLLAAQQEKNAMAVLQQALKVAKSPQEAAIVQNAMEAVQRSQAVREQTEEANRQIQQELQSASSETQTSANPLDGKSGVAAAAVQSSDESLKGPHHSVSGTIKNVRCTPPAIMDLEVDSGGRTVALHARNYYKIEFTAANFVPKGDLHPCSDLEGARALIEYVETSREPKPGGIVSIQMTK
jgi:tetratricopeptide (TPR) repeat protein